MDFIFGYGSIINEASRQSTALNAGMSAEAAVIVRLLDSTLRRRWCFRSHTGFTALGLERITCHKEMRSKPIVGILFPVNKEVLDEFDAREVGYQRISIDSSLIDVVEDFGDERTKQVAREYKDLLRLEQTKVWVYIPEEDRA